MSSRAATTSSMPNFTKPVVACVVGRWKSKLTRAVGHAGAMAGGDDDAAGKERWFMEKFGVDGIFTPDNPVFSARGAVVTNIAHIPAALTAVMRENGARPDFAAEGSLALKPWFGSNQGLTLPPRARPAGRSRRSPPYNEQIAALEPADRRGVPAADDEGRLRRVADGPEDAGHQPARRLDAGCCAESVRGEPVASRSAARARRRERPSARSTSRRRR